MERLLRPVSFLGYLAPLINRPTMGSEFVPLEAISIFKGATTAF
jgi:hypothetical protein